MDYATKLKSLNEIRYKDYQNKQEIIGKVKNILQPEVNLALRKLIEKLETLDSVRLYSEQLQSQKVKDKIEQKKHEKQRLKEELGSEYESSEESNLYDEFGDKMMEDDSSQMNELEDKTKQLFSDLDSEQEHKRPDHPIIIQSSQMGFQEEEKEQSTNFLELPQVKQKFLVAGIQEEEEIEEDQFSVRNNFRDKFLQHQLKQFNPVKFLAKTIKEIIGKPMDSDEEKEEEFEVKRKEEQDATKEPEENKQDNQ